MLWIAVAFGNLDLWSIRCSHPTNSQSNYPEQVACLQPVLSPGMMSYLFPDYPHTEIGCLNMEKVDCRCMIDLLGLLHAFHTSVGARGRRVYLLCDGSMTMDEVPVS